MRDVDAVKATIEDASDAEVGGKVQRLLAAEAAGGPRAMCALAILAACRPTSLHRVLARERAAVAIRAFLDSSAAASWPVVASLAELAAERGVAALTGDEAWRLGFVCVRKPAPFDAESGLWSDESTLRESVTGAITAAAGGAARSDPVDRRAHAVALLAPYGWLDDRDRVSLISWGVAAGPARALDCVEERVLHLAARRAVEALAWAEWDREGCALRIETACGTLLGVRLAPGTLTVPLAPEAREALLAGDFARAGEWARAERRRLGRERREAVLASVAAACVAADQLGVDLSRSIRRCLRSDEPKAALEVLAAETRNRRAVAIRVALRERGFEVGSRNEVRAIVAERVAGTVTFRGRPVGVALWIPASAVVADLAEGERVEAYAERIATALGPRDHGSVFDELEGALGELDRSAAADETALVEFYDRELLLSELERALGRDAPDETLARGRLAELVRGAGELVRGRAERARHVSHAERHARLTDYAASFPVARSLGRSWTLYVGEANSGKTYRALERLAAAPTGVYLAPLRLLALEGQEELERRGRTTSLVTGEERDTRPDASHVASTIEMLDTTRPVEAVLVDEAQMLADLERGAAWTAALFGAPARTVLLTGSAASVDAVGRAAAALGDPLEVVRCERYAGLEVLACPVASLGDVPAASAIVAFSRREVLALKARLESQGRRVSVVYGALSPEVRREQAAQFRAGRSEVLVSTDAIAMGLNLPVETVLFWATDKFDGRRRRALTGVEIRQIAGRAGRYGHYEVGRVGAFSCQDLERISAALASGEERAPSRLFVRPHFAHVERLPEAIATDRLGEILRFFRDEMLRHHELLEPAALEQTLALADRLDQARLSLADRFVLSSCPVRLRDRLSQDLWWRAVRARARSEAIGAPSVPTRFAAPEASAADQHELEEAEGLVRAHGLYGWLAHRMPDTFPDDETAREARTVLNGFIDRSLTRSRLDGRCRWCGRRVAATSGAALCARCEE